MQRCFKTVQTAYLTLGGFESLISAKEQEVHWKLTAFEALRQKPNAGG